LQVLGPDGYHSLGQDIVNHCVNDILVKGARPLFFLDYIASSQLNANHVSNFVAGAAKACRDAGCVLIGGETAEMPDVYNKGHTDIVGTIVGVVTPEAIIDGPSTIVKGDIVIGLRSSGPHTNGYSLIRKLIPNLRPEDVAAHRCYLKDIEKIRGSGVTIKGLCHITGGGWWGNIKRVLPKGHAVDLLVPRESEESIFSRVQQAGGISDEDMLNIFNMGFGMLIVVDPNECASTLRNFSPDYAKVLGTVQKGIVPQIKIS
ncbi:hypothetical protein LCGC14_2868330, partial [marine sediment metagenome]